MGKKPNNGKSVAISAIPPWIDGHPQLRQVSANFFAKSEKCSPISMAVRADVHSGLLKHLT
jgi:hypothetical protein